ncbi:MAG: FAD-dependent oxidoreductase [Tannerella sp.]|jgi:hypothetical protein|nr:FAD-dependent oxidoreductase [Tannerella sp.]
MKKQTRRDFIKHSTIGGIAATTGLSGLYMKSYGASSADGVEAKSAYSFKRDIPVDSEVYDLIIAGGGPAGIGAGIAAARLGAKALIIEAMGCLGGMGTSGLVTAFDPMANGEEMLVGGIMHEIVFKMYERGFLGPREKPEVFAKSYHHWTSFHAEGYKLLLDEMIVEAGIEVRFFTRVIAADADPKKGRVNGIIQQNVEGLRYVRAKTFIDATGDAILSEFCGVKYREAGIDMPGAMPPTLCSYVANVNGKHAGNGGQESPALFKAIADGHFTQPDKHVPGAFHVSETINYFNTGHVFGTNAMNCASLTQAMIKGRKIVQEFVSYYKKYVPGYENIELVATAALLGVRESRRIVGEYELCYADYEARRHFPDQIGIFNKAVDIHIYDTSEEEYQRYRDEYTRTSRLNPGEYFGIPYSILAPKGWTNLWVAGRCNSSDVKVHGSIRVQPAANMMGQAAGTAAVQSIRTGQPACDLNTEELVKTLRKAGANLPQKTLSSKMTRS